MHQEGLPGGTVDLGTFSTTTNAAGGWAVGGGGAERAGGRAGGYSAEGGPDGNADE